MWKILEPYFELLFPVICPCCGSSIQQPDKHLCNWCAKERFEYSGLDPDLILPDSVKLQFSMWKFDKGGYLQQMLHNLKYNYLQSVGVDLGGLLAEKFLSQSHIYLDEIFRHAEPIIVPIPLHKSKLRKRGFNQAGALATGFAKKTGWKIIRKGTVLRVKRTKTQTGLSVEKRTGNLKNAFLVKGKIELEDKIPVIIDDVFTTGATTFELAGVLHKISNPAVIVTVAKA
ncbi:MAG: ComF family protein [Bacteroidota bacterium]|uniref:ComF family protein n=2 Tax=Rhodohalobacter sp. TaxID=1974210 RepID=UPI003974B886